jgi:DNA primase
MFTSVIVALDNDDAGKDAAASLVPGLRKRGCVPIPWDYRGLRDEDGRKVKDVGDAANDDDLIRAYQRTIGRGFTC